MEVYNVIAAVWCQKSMVEQGRRQISYKVIN